MTTPQDNSWAYALKPGDKVAIRAGNPYGAPYEIATFSRATATLLVFDERGRIERRVRKDNLYIQKSYGRIEPLTDKVIEANARHRMITDLAGLREADLKRLETPALRAIHEALKLGEVIR